MRLYATTTSERASKSQGGEYLYITIQDESRKEIARVYVKDEKIDFMYFDSIYGITLNGERIRGKGNNQKGDKPDKYDIMLAGLQ